MRLYELMVARDVFSRSAIARTIVKVDASQNKTY